MKHWFVVCMKSLRKANTASNRIANFGQRLGSDLFANAKTQLQISDRENNLAV